MTHRGLSNHTNTPFETPPAILSMFSASAMLQARLKLANQQLKHHGLPATNGHLPSASNVIIIWVGGIPAKLDSLD